MKQNQVQEIKINNIKNNPYQTRLFIDKEPLKVLTKSIRERGLFNPITVLEKSKDEYIVVHGHRRLAACKKLKWKTIPAFVKPKSEENSLITDLIHENLIREDLSVQEKALSIKLLFSQIKNLNNDLDKIMSCINTGKTYNQRGERVGRGRHKCSDKKIKFKISDDDMFMGMKLLKTIGISENNAISYLTILKLPAHIQRLVNFNVHNDQGERSSTRISIRMACNLARVDDEGYRNYLLSRALQGSSARHIEALINNYKLKVLKGEWEGFVKKFNNVKIIKSINREMFLDLADKCKELYRKLNSWKLTKLSALAEVLEKEVFIAEAAALRKEIRVVDEQLKKRLEDKGYKNVEKNLFNEVFEIQVKESQQRKMVRGTIPRKMLRKLGVKDKDLITGTFIQLKIVGIKGRPIGVE